MMECELKSAVSCPKLRKTMAYHEGGHALVSIHTDGALPLHKVTIVPDFKWLRKFTQLQLTCPRFPSISWMKILANPDGYVRKRGLAQLDMLMGGRVAEELIFGESIPGGDLTDIELATGIARAMLTIDGPQNYDDMSTETRLLIDEEVRELLKRANENAKTILSTHKNELHALANALLEHETLSGSQVKAILAQTNSEQPLLTRLFWLARLRLNEL
ncbi:hypothetical protein RD792_013128 [Penstemon davidsonii]|uniref:Peptidase M41 domain-containing protein n=1 Tax=Penstemon davidsonii TaxID=160366 RepID=A0ABR0CU57_9LAMI|nr:hypothetical protein RD792_013128 [Penstemon davidsonii]